MERHLATLWEHVADAVPDATAIVHGDVRRSYREWDDRSARLAGALSAAGLGVGSKVAQYLYNGCEYVESYAAALKIRGVPVNVNYRYLDDELLYLLENSEAEALVFHSSLADRVARVVDRASGLKLVLEVDDGGDAARTVPGAVPYEVALADATPAPRIERDPTDVLLLYTGGTTGMPKGVMTKNGSAVAGAIGTIASVTGVAPAEDAADVPELVRTFVAEHGQFVTLPACPLMHGTGMASLAPTLGGGGKLVLLAGRGLDVDELWSTVEREGVNSLVIVGDAFARPMLRALRDGSTAWDLSSVRFVWSAGAMFSAEIREGLLDHMPGATIIDSIAASEGGMGVAMSTKGNVVPTGSFLPNPGVKLFTEDGVEVAPGSGELGMLAVPGAIPDGYFHDSEKTARTFREFGGVRYSIPGDWGTIGADGILTLMGRGSQCINTGGEKVFPEEVEETLKLHPSVEDALVFGLPDERFGQRVAAVVSLSPDADAGAVDPKAIVDGVRDRLSSYKLPRDVAIVGVVPRAANGKADYPRARELFEEMTSSPRQ